MAKSKRKVWEEVRNCPNCGVSTRNDKGKFPPRFDATQCKACNGIPYVPNPKNITSESSR